MLDVEVMRGTDHHRMDTGILKGLGIRAECCHPSIRDLIGLRPHEVAAGKHENGLPAERRP
jgi:hypothetical protein